MGYDSAFKTKVILKHATTWMKLEVTTLSEINQSQKYKYQFFKFGKTTMCNDAFALAIKMWDENSWKASSYPGLRTYLGPRHTVDTDKCFGA